MKIRSGFVSNSSSSSFIVGFPKLPNTPEELEKMMFFETGIFQPEDYYSPTTTLEVAKRVFNDMSVGNWKGARLTKKKSVEVLLEGHFPGDPPYNWSKKHESDKVSETYEKETGIDICDEKSDPDVVKLVRKLRRKEWDVENKIRKSAAVGFISGWWPSVRKMKVFHFEYSDSTDGNLEHGNIFRKLPHVRISKH